MFCSRLPPWPETPPLPPKPSALHPTPTPFLPTSAEWMESQGEDPAQLTYAQLMERASQGGNWQRALELFDGELVGGWAGRWAGVWVSGRAGGRGARQAHEWVGDSAVSRGAGSFSQGREGSCWGVRYAFLTPGGLQVRAGLEHELPWRPVVTLLFTGKQQNLPCLPTHLPACIPPASLSPCCPRVQAWRAA